nr:MAG TPA: hypothetical protein [Caudoviricetes sp.]
MHKSLAICDYNRKKICDLYDSNVQNAGQAFDIQKTISISGEQK